MGTIGIKVDDETMELYKELTTKQKQELINTLKIIIYVYVRRKSIDYRAIPSVKKEIDMLNKALYDVMVENFNLKEEIKRLKDTIQHLQQNR